jgi:hypothetical protein
MKSAIEKKKSVQLVGFTENRGSASSQNVQEKTSYLAGTQLPQVFQIP